MESKKQTKYARRIHGISRNQIFNFELHGKPGQYRYVDRKYKIAIILIGRKSTKYPTPKLSEIRRIYVDYGFKVLLIPFKDLDHPSRWEKVRVRILEAIISQLLKQINS